MTAAFGARFAGGRDGDDKIQRRHEKYELPAVTPGVESVMAREFTDPPSVSVIPVALAARDSTRRQRSLNPLFGNDLRSVNLSAAKVHLSEGKHLTGRHAHIVPAKVDTLWIAWPLHQRESHRLRERLLSELPGALPCGLGEYRRQQVGVARAVGHHRSRSAQHGTRQGMSNPI